MPLGCNTYFCSFMYIVPFLNRLLQLRVIIQFQGLHFMYAIRHGHFSFTWWTFQLVSLLDYTLLLVYPLFCHIDGYNQFFVVKLCRGKYLMKFIQALGLWRMRCRRLKNPCWTILAWTISIVHSLMKPDSHTKSESAYLYAYIN